MYGVILSIYNLSTFYTVHFTVLFYLYIIINLYLNLCKDYPWNIKSDCFKEKQQSQNFLNKSFFISQAQILSISLFLSPSVLSFSLSFFLPLSLSLCLSISLFLSPFLNTPKIVLIQFI